MAVIHSPNPAARHQYTHATIDSSVYLSKPSTQAARGSAGKTADMQPKARLLYKSQKKACQSMSLCRAQIGCYKRSHPSTTSPFSTHASELIMSPMQRISIVQTTVHMDMR